MRPEVGSESDSSDNGSMVETEEYNFAVQASRTQNRFKQVLNSVHELAR